MMRNWTSLGYRAILTALLTAPVVVPVAAAAPPPEKEAPTPEQIDKKMVEFGQAVKADIDGLKKEIEGLKKQLSGIQSDLEKLKQAPGVPSGPGVSTKELEDKLGQLQRELELLRQKLPTTTTVLRPGAAGRLDLVNDFPFTVDFVINERVYPVRGNSTQEVTIPVGSTFTFRIPSVPGYQTSQSRLMGGERPHMLRVHPLP